MKSLRCARVTLTLLLLAASAHAQGTQGGSVSQAPATLAPPLTPPEPTTEWYGWQVLVSDGVTLGSTIAVGMAGGGVIGITANAGAGFGLGPMVVHLAHGRPLVAFLDVGMRAGLLFLGGLVGQAAMSCGPSPPPAPEPGYNDHGSHGLCLGAGAVLGGGLGAVTAITIDAAALSWADKPVRPVAMVGQAFTLEPTVLWSKEQAGMGLKGTF